jgi:hypothetical protein
MLIANGCIEKRDVKGGKKVKFSQNNLKYTKLCDVTDHCDTLHSL